MHPVKLLKYTSATGAKGSILANLDIVICDLYVDAERNKYNTLLVMSSLYLASDRVIGNQQRW